MSDTKPDVRRRSIMRGVAWATPTALTAVAAPAIAASNTLDCLEINLPVGAQTTMSWDSDWVETVNSANFVAGSGDLAGPAADWTPSGGSRCRNGNSVSSVTGVKKAKNGQRDPRVNGASFSYERSVCFAPGTYQIRYYAAAYRGNPVTAYMTPSVRNSAGTAVATSLITGGPTSQSVTANGFVNPTTGSGTNSAYSATNMGRTEFGFQFTVTKQGTFTFRFDWSFGRLATDSANTGRLTQTNILGDSCIPTFANDIAVEAPIVRRTA